MAYINGEFQHKDYEIQISVLEPTKEENNFNEGMQISVDWDNFLTTDLQEFRNILKWMSEKADYIEQNFTKNGRAQKITLVG